MIRVLSRDHLPDTIHNSTLLFYIVFFAGKCLFLSGLVPRPMNAENDKELLSYGIGFTNIVERTTRANQELSRQEIEEGND